MQGRQKVQLTKNLTVLFKIINESSSSGNMNRDIVERYENGIKETKTQQTI